MSNSPEPVELPGRAAPPADAAAPPARQQRRALRWGLAFAAGLLLVAGVSWPQYRPLVHEYLFARLATGEALRRLEQDDFAGALAQLDRAIAWSPGNLQRKLTRAQWRLEAGDPQGALEDLDALVKANPSFAGFYSVRSQALHRLGRNREALHDARKASELRPQWDPSALNERAYLRAQLNLELDEALQDINLALSQLPTEGLAATDARMAMLDTRGYILYRLGDFASALADCELAISLAEPLAEQERATTLTPRRERRLNENLSVLYQHRGLAHEALGNKEAAKADLERAKELGYDPSRGVF